MDFVWLFAFWGISLWAFQPSEFLPGSSPSKAQLEEAAQVRVSQVLDRSQSLSRGFGSPGSRSSGLRADSCLDLKRSFDTASEILDKDPVQQTYVCLPPEAMSEDFVKKVLEAHQALEATPKSEWPSPKKPHVKIHKFDLSHTNDLNVYEAARGVLSDDVGRTAQFDGNYEQVWSDGSTLYLAGRSTGFGRRQPHRGAHRDQAGHIWLGFADHTTVKLGGTKPLGPQEGNVRDRIVLEFSADRIGSDGLSRQVQDSWHRLIYSEKPGRTTGPIYRYQPLDLVREREFQTVMAGVQRQISTDLGKFHCIATGTAMVGRDTLGRNVAETRGQIEINTGRIWGGSRENPALALTVFGDRSVRSEKPGLDDNQGSRGARLTASKQISRNVTGQVYVGKVYYSSELDKASTKGVVLEGVYTYGVVLTYRK